MLDNSEIKLKDFFNILWNRKNKILGFGLLSSIFFIIYSLSIPPVYTSSALIKVSDSQQTSASLNSSLSGLASLAGINLRGGGGNKSDLVMETVTSRTFFTHLAKIDNTLPNLMAIDSYDKNSNKIIFDTNKYDPVKGEWIEEPSEFLSYIRYRKSILSITRDKFTNFMVISVTHASPEYSKKLLETIVSELNLLARADQKAESDQTIKFLNNELARTNFVDIKNTINLLLKSELQKKMFAEVVENYLVDYIDYPFTPETQSAPNKKVIVIFGVLFSNLLFIFALLAYVLFKGRRT